MRKLLLPLAVAGLLTACGGGDDGDDVDAVDDGTTTSTTATTVTGGGSSTTVTVAPGGSVDPTGTTAPIVADTTVIDPATVETLPPAPDPGPTDPGFAPADPGTYAYATTGMVAGRPVNETQNFVVTPLGPSEVRYAAPGQVIDLQYRADGVYLRQLVATFANQTVTFQSADGVLFIPIPQDAGRTWDWSLPDSTGAYNAAWHATTLPGERITAGGAEVDTTVIDAAIHLTGNSIIGPVDGNVTLKLWIDPARRLPVQLHQVISISKPALAAGQGADTTSTFQSFTPA